MTTTGPEVIKTVLGEEISMEDLGGAKVHSEITGNAHFYSESEPECFEQIKTLVSYIPWNNTKKPVNHTLGKPKKGFKIEEIVPEDLKEPYDVRDVIRSLTDNSDFFEVHKLYARNIVIGFGHIAGRPIGIIANQPKFLAGVLDVNASDKAARFIRTCAAIPSLSRSKPNRMCSVPT